VVDCQASTEHEYHASNRHYDLMSGTYCRDGAGQIGATQIGVGPNGCERMCAEYPGCVAFVMDHGQNDCILRRSCARRGRSRQCTYVVLMQDLPSVHCRWPGERGCISHLSSG